MKCLLNHEPFPIIPELDVGILSPSDTTGIGEYLAKLGPSLDHLSLGFSSFDAGGDAEDFYLNCDLSHNTSLRSVHIHRLIDNWKTSLSSPVPWNLKSLARIQSRILKTISFSLYLSHASQLDVEDLPVDFDWDEIDRFFAEGNLPYLEIVRFDLFIDIIFGCWIGETIRRLEECLPLSHKKGLLRFSRGCTAVPASLRQYARAYTTVQDPLTSTFPQELTLDA
ncbi:hypothetical protein K435DRAFT_277372 [Dendrothele bispora CBS 962.96]|uniref:F-box domain-containing protein n=1 Tax=Dendrothele bispora (strain CBS 962.96) TaxID=1314807 RepID=A0A4V4HE97_DENBC|nr:hypothetical protein K435DRAFT_277372 [Dendrothele bispora CBS 962.96]